MSVDVTKPQHYRKLRNGQIVRKFPKLRGKAVVKAAKKARQERR